MAARWRSKAKMMSPFDSPILILYRLSVEIFRLSLTVQKLFDCIDLAGNLASRSQNLGFSGGFWPLNVISYQRDLQKALPYSKLRRLTYGACKSVEPFGL